jgi:hypothetical protein
MSSPVPMTAWRLHALQHLLLVGAQLLLQS